MSSANVSSATATNKLYGCTCGQCVGGWLSPRMIYRLRSEAAKLNTIMLHSNLSFERYPNKTMPAAEAIMRPNAEFIPPPAYAHGLEFSFYQGYATAFLAAYNLLNETPTPEFTTATVRAHAQEVYAEDMTRFFDNGGQVAWALDCMTQVAEEEPNAEEDEALPKCKNDDQFAFVRRMIGLDSDKRWGRYGGAEDEEREEFGDDFFFGWRKDSDDDGDGEMDIALFRRLEQRLAQMR